MNDMTTLLALVKRHQHITWDSTKTDQELKDIIENAVPVMQHKIGNGSIDFTEGGINRTLFMNYCLYARNQCLNEYDKAYMPMIIEARNIAAVSEMEAELAE